MKLPMLILALALATSASAQDYVPTLTHGPLVGVIAVAKGGDEAYHAGMLDRVGWELGINLAQASSETALVSITMPHLMGFNSAEDHFRYSTGLMIKFLGMFGMGATYDLIKTPDTGLMTGKSSWADNGTLLFAISFPMNGGGLLNLRTD